MVEVTLSKHYYMYVCMDILRPELDVVGRLPNPSDIQFYFKGKDVSPV